MKKRIMNILLLFILAAGVLPAEETHTLQVVSEEPVTVYGIQLTGDHEWIFIFSDGQRYKVDYTYTENRNEFYVMLLSQYTYLAGLAGQAIKSRGEEGNIPLEALDREHRHLVKQEVTEFPCEFSARGEEPYLLIIRDNDYYYALQTEKVQDDLTIDLADYLFRDVVIKNTLGRGILRAAPEAGTVFLAIDEAPHYKAAFDIRVDTYGETLASTLTLPKVFGPVTVTIEEMEFPGPLEWFITSKVTAEELKTGPAEIGLPPGSRQDVMLSAPVPGTVFSLSSTAGDSWIKSASPPPVLIEEDRPFPLPFLLADTEIKARAPEDSDREYQPYRETARIQKLLTHHRKIRLKPEGDVSVDSSSTLDTYHFVEYYIGGGPLFFAPPESFSMSGDVSFLGGINILRFPLKSEGPLWNRIFGLTAEVPTDFETLSANLSIRFGRGLYLHPVNPQIQFELGGSYPLDVFAGIQARLVFYLGSLTLSPYAYYRYYAGEALGWTSGGAALPSFSAGITAGYFHAGGN